MLAHDTYVTTVHALSGAVGGVASRTATAPADRVRTLLQAGLGVPVRPPGYDKVKLAKKYRAFLTEGAVRSAVSHIYHHGGWRSFYRGNGTNCIKVAPDAAVQFAVNRIVTQWFAADSQSVSLGQRFVAGGIAGAASQTLIHPIDVLKTQMTVASCGEYRGLADCIKRTAHDRTLGGNMAARFYRGYGAALLGIVPFMGTKLGLFTFVCTDYRRRNDGRSLGGIQGTLAAAGCSFLGITVAYPLNLARTKLQVQGVNGRSKLYSGVFDCLRTTVRHEKLLGLYRGFVPNLLKALPSESILLSVQRVLAEALL